MRDKIVPMVWFYSSYFKTRNKVLFYLFYLIHKILSIVFVNDLSTNVILTDIPKMYHAFGIIVGSGTEIGSNVTFRARVTLGETTIASQDCPIIGDNVEFGVGACVFGSGILESDSKVKANEVIVLK